jgi:hypothetical protein
MTTKRKTTKLKPVKSPRICFGSLKSSVMFSPMFLALFDYL